GSAGESEPCARRSSRPGCVACPFEGTLGRRRVPNGTGRRHARISGHPMGRPDPNEPCDRGGHMGSVIVGTGAGIPEQVVTNHDLARIMDTTDEWVVSRSGVHERRFAPPGTGSSDLAAEAVTAALADAGVDPGEVDALITATMTPDRYAPGIAGAVQHKAGLGHIGVFDLRAQCAGFLYGMDLADMLLAT